MGLATAGGTVLALSPLGFLIGVGVLIAILLIIRHAARAAMVTGLLLAPIYLLAGLDMRVVQIGLAVGLVIILRFRQDWNRHYRELWLDREQEG
jgi:glycerol-3-phosphate acyltransferase PlsY